MFASDRFHPSAAGYVAAIGAMLPTVVAAVDGAVDAARIAGPDEGVRSLAQAAAEAVDQAGTEVSAAQVAGRAGRWADLRHRMWARTERPQDPVGPTPSTVE
jgi:hypothetical protein